MNMQRASNNYFLLTPNIATLQKQYFQGYKSFCLIHVLRGKNDDIIQYFTVRHTILQMQWINYKANKSTKINPQQQEIGILKCEIIEREMISGLLQSVQPVVNKNR